MDGCRADYCVLRFTLLLEQRKRGGEGEGELSLSLTRWNETNRDWTVDGGMERNGTSTHTICNWLAG